jgi:hypothetical protein
MKIQTVNETIEIPLFNKNGMVVAKSLIDSVNFDKVNQCTWSLSKGGYANGSMKIGDITVRISMHRLIMDAQTGTIIDHKNHKKLDNRGSNLKFVTSNQNNQNRTKLTNTTSKYYGVSFRKSGVNKKWLASLAHKSLGCFASEEDAAYYYDCKAKELYGVDAKINNIPKPDNFEIPKKLNLNYVLIDGKPARGLTKIGQKYKLSVCPKGKSRQYIFATLEEAKAKYLELKTPQEKIPVQPMNIPRNEQGIAILPCTNTLGVFVDDDVYLKYYAQSCWLTGDAYPSVWVNKVQNMLHRNIVEAQQLDIVDHINHDKMNCQRSNLRITNSSVNAHNVSKRKNTSSQYSGVSKNGKYFKVQICKDGIKYSGGSYKLEQIAGWAATQLSKELYGSYATNNHVQLEGYVFKNRRAILQDDLNQKPSKKLKLK